MANMVNSLRAVFGGRLRESVSASAEPQLQRGGIDDDDELEESTLSTKDRKNLDKSDFAIPEKAPGSGSYPIPDESHARNALARVAQHGTPEEQKRVKAAVHKKFPNIDKDDDGKGSKSRESFTLLIREATVRKNDGVYEVTIVREGPGNPTDRRFYTRQALQQAVQDGRFEGLQAYLNHPTRSEERERPERDVRYLAGHFREARFVDGNPAEVRAKFVPGGMEKDKVISLIESALDSPQDKPLVGISIDGYGKTDQQDINGTTYHAVREVTHLGSADIVTRAGAGGQFRRRLKERNPGSIGRPDTSKEATMTADELQEKVRAAASKLAEAAALDGDDEKAGGLIDQGLTLLRECADCKVDVPVREKRVEVPVAASDDKADELAAKLQEATTALETEREAHKVVADKLATVEAAQAALKVIREKDVPERFRETWFPEVAAQADEDAMVALVDRKLAERAAYLAEFQESVGVEGAGRRQPALVGSTSTGGGLYAALGLDRDDA